MDNIKFCVSGWPARGHVGFRVLGFTHIGDRVQGLHLDNRPTLTMWGAIRKNDEQVYVTLDELWRCTNGEHIHMAAKTTEVMSYTAGIGTALSGAFGWLDEHAHSESVLCIAIVTCAANMYFRLREQREFKRRGKNAQR